MWTAARISTRQLHAHAFSESFQFPGEALLQADEAKRTAEIARLTYEAAVRDLRAGVETAYYQVLLDEALIAVNAENIANLKQVVHVTQVQYTAGQAAQADLIGAEFALEQAQLQQRQYETNRVNDRVGLNQLLYRKPASPLNLDRRSSSNGWRSGWIKRSTPQRTRARRYSKPR